MDLSCIMDRISKIEQMLKLSKIHERRHHKNQRLWNECVQDVMSKQFDIDIPALLKLKTCKVSYVAGDTVSVTKEPSTLNVLANANELLGGTQAHVAQINTQNDNEEKIITCLGNSTQTLKETMMETNETISMEWTSDGDRETCIPVTSNDENGTEKNSGADSGITSLLQGNVSEKESECHPDESECLDSIAMLPLSTEDFITTDIEEQESPTLAFDDVLALYEDLINVNPLLDNRDEVEINIPITKPVICPPETSQEYVGKQIVSVETETGASTEDGQSNEPTIVPTACTNQNQTIPSDGLKTPVEDGEDSDLSKLLPEIFTDSLDKAWGDKKLTPTLNSPRGSNVRSTPLEQFPKRTEPEVIIVSSSDDEINEQSRGTKKVIQLSQAKRNLMADRRASAIDERRRHLNLSGHTLTESSSRSIQSSKLGTYGKRKPMPNILLINRNKFRNLSCSSKVFPVRNSPSKSSLTFENSGCTNRSVLESALKRQNITTSSSKTVSSSKANDSSIVEVISTENIQGVEAEVENLLVTPNADGHSTSQSKSSEIQDNSLNSSPSAKSKTTEYFTDSSMTQNETNEPSCTTESESDSDSEGKTDSSRKMHFNSTKASNSRRSHMQIREKILKLAKKNWKKGAYLKPNVRCVAIIAKSAKRIIEHDGSHYVCGVCRTVKTENSTKIFNHARTHFIKESYKCMECRYISSNRINYIHHLKDPINLNCLRAQAQLACDSSSDADNFERVLLAKQSNQNSKSANLMECRKLKMNTVVSIERCSMVEEFGVKYGALMKRLTAIDFPIP